MAPKVYITGQERQKNKRGSGIAVDAMSEPNPSNAEKREAKLSLALCKIKTAPVVMPK